MVTKGGQTMYTVFLIDDEKGIIEGLKIIIRRYLPQCKVIGCAYDGIEGYLHVLELSPDIVITDIRMLQRDGLEMIEMLVSEGVQSRFIILSGYSEFEYARRGMQSGVKYYLTKPIEELELQESVNRIIQEIEASRKKEEQRTGNPNDNRSRMSDDLLKKKDVISEIKQYVLEKYNSNVSLAELSNRFYFNLHYLSQLFKEKTGQTYLEYLTQVRIEKAKQLLLQSDYKVYEISQMVGYSDTTHFSKLFEKATGCKPSEYRKMKP